MSNVVCWEYLTYRPSSYDPPEAQDEPLQGLGDLGWELVAAVQMSGGRTVLYFKRAVVLEVG